MTGEQAKGALRAALHHRDFRILLTAQTISDTGNWLYSVALIVYVLDQTGSAAWVAATSVIRFLPVVLLGPIGGAIADRYDRRSVMIAMDLARVVLMTGLVVVALADGPALLAILIAAGSVTCSVPYYPSVAAAVPALVGEDDLTAANAIRSTVDNVTLALGPAVGGLILAFGSTALAFGVNAATFVVSAALTLRIRTALHPDAADGQEGPVSLGRRVAEGVHAITTSREVVLLTVVAIAFMTFYGQEIVLYALTATERLGLGDEGVGYLFAATGVGGVLAAGAVARTGGRPRQGSLLVLAVVLSALPIMALSVVSSPGVAYALLLFEGVGFILGDVISMTMLQRILPGDVMGRVFGIMDSLAVAGILLGSVLAPLAVRALGLEGALIAAGGLLLIAGLAFLPRAREIDGRTAERVAALASRVGLLSRLDLFAAAQQPTLEALAEASTEERVVAGTVVIREGDPADALYVVARGRLQVTSSGEVGGDARPIGELASGDYFGEIGLIERIRAPRP